MNLSSIGLVAVILGVVTFIKWRKRKGEMTIFHALVWWVFAIAVALGVIMIANLITDKFSA